jgi:hypothetical protein
VGIRERAAGYELVAAGSTTQALGTDGGPGDYLARIVMGANTGAVTVFDGATPVFVIPAGTIGAIEVGAICTTNWNITTAADTSCIGVGDFFSPVSVTDP